MESINKFRWSFWALLLAVAVLGYASWGYYSKSRCGGSEATISWDVSGYYMYLPAFLIYDDAKELAFLPTIFEKYQPTPNLQQAYKHESGHYVFKYSSGLAIQMAPFFLVAHVLAKPLGYAADGFSWPYQWAIHFGSFLMLLLGLWGLRKLLLRFFSDAAVAITILLVALGSNYLNVCAIDGAMTHNWLFTWYVWLMLTTDNYYRRPSLRSALAIGFCIGIMTLTRPTEALSVLIPLLWAWPTLSFAQRLRFWGSNIGFVVAAVVLAAAIVSIQLFYWHYATGQWVVYSYQDQGFHWLHPHMWQYNFSPSSGWLRYSPLWMLAFAGMWWVARSRAWYALAVPVFALLNWYVVCSWSEWYYGGRAMVQSYPVLAFALAALSTHALQSKWRTAILCLLGGVAMYLNICLTHQQHKGGIISATFNSSRYFWRTLGRWTRPEEVLKLQDTKYLFEGTPKNIVLIDTFDYEKGDSCIVHWPDIIGCADWVNGNREWSETLKWASPRNRTDKSWIRAGAVFTMPQVEYDEWKMPQLKLSFLQSGKEVQGEIIRLGRFLHDGQPRFVYIDSRIPTGVDSMAVSVWNSGSDKVLYMDNWRIEQFSE